MNTGLKSGINIHNAVGREDAFVVFQRSGEDRDDFVAFEIVG